MRAALSSNKDELLYFWALGDLHFRALPAWNELHKQRLLPMFEDLQLLWEAEGRPAFCVSPGDLVEMGILENHQLAKLTLNTRLSNIPFYSGLGNHEFYVPNRTGSTNPLSTYTMIWSKPARYAWTINNFVCIMLDYPDPFTAEDATKVFISRETLTFLDETLTQYAELPAIIFLHCPLRNTVLDRDEKRHRDYNSLQNFFSPENSNAIRDILAHHKNACFYLSGHTHSGWEAPYLVCTEQLGGHPVTFVNLMSPWYTGTHTGPRLSADYVSINYVPDTPDVIPTFAIRLYQTQALIRVRDHLTRSWLKEWVVPLRTSR